MYPLHPMIVHFPVALLLISVLLDFGAVRRGQAEMAAYARRALKCGLVSGVVAAVSGLADVARSGGAITPADARTHLVLAIALLALAAGLLLWRRKMQGPVTGAYLAAGSVMAALLVVVGYLGGKLAYGV